MRSSGQTSNRTLSSHNTGVGGTDQFIGAAENADLDWLRSRLTPHLWKTYSEPLWLTRDRKRPKPVSPSASTDACVHPANRERRPSGGGPRGISRPDTKS